MTLDAQSFYEKQGFTFIKESLYPPALTQTDLHCTGRAFQIFSLADIQFGHVLYRYYDIDVARQPLPNLRAYYDQLVSRPAYREHVIVSYEDLRA